MLTTTSLAAGLPAAAASSAADSSAGLPAQAEFTPVDSGNPKQRRESGLFNMLRRNPKQFLTSHIFQFKSDRDPQYLIINLPVAEELRSDLRAIGFDIVAQHLRIDQIYNEIASHDNNNFSYAHITFTLQNRRGENFKCRLYLNAHGKIITCIAKQYASDADQEGSVIELSIDKIVAINQAAQTGQELLNSFIKLKDLQYQEILTESNRLEMRLAELFSAYVSSHNAKNCQQYLTCAKEFVAAIDKLNFYAEAHLDLRGEFVQNVITKLTTAHSFQQRRQAQTVASAEVRASADEVVAEASPAAAEATKLPAASTPPFAVLQQMYDEFAKHAQAANIENIADYLQAHKLALAMQPQVLLCLIAEDLTAAGKNQINSIEAQLQKFYNLTSIFTDAVYADNLAVVKALHSYVRDQLPPNFCLEYLDFLINKEEEQGTQICQFFYDQHDMLYEMTLRLLKIRFKTEHGADQMLRNNLNAMLGKDNKLELFKMFLHHGLDPNIPSCIIDTKYIYLLPLLVFACGNDDNQGIKYLPFVQALLAHGAMVEYPKILGSTLHRTDGKGRIRRRQISMQDFLGRQQAPAAALAATEDGRSADSFYQIPEDISALTQVTSALEVLAIHSKKIDPDIIATLLPKTSLINIARAIGAFTTVKEIMSRITLGECIYQIHAYPTVKDCDENMSVLVENFMAEWTANNKPFRFTQLYYGDGRQSANVMRNLELLVNAFKQKYATILAEQPDQINKANKELYNEAKEYAQSAQLCLVTGDLDKALEHNKKALCYYKSVLVFLTMPAMLLKEHTLFLKNIYLQTAKQLELRKILFSQKGDVAVAQTNANIEQYYRIIAANIQSHHDRVYPAEMVLAPAAAAAGLAATPHPDEAAAPAGSEGKKLAVGDVKKNPYRRK